MRKLMPKFGYEFSYSEGEWTDSDGNVIPDDQIDDEHLKLFINLSKRTMIRNIANVRAKR